MAPVVARRAARYAEVQERLIASDGSFPPLGRSLAYRCAAAARRGEEGGAYRRGPASPVPVRCCCRSGAFQLLAMLAAQERLPPSLPPGQVGGTGGWAPLSGARRAARPRPPAQVRAGLSAVLRRCLDAPGTYDARGWLTVGLCGHQLEIGEMYISTGSLYLVRLRARGRAALSLRCGMGIAPSHSHCRPLLLSSPLGSHPAHASGPIRQWTGLRNASGLPELLLGSTTRWTTTASNVSELLTDTPPVRA